MGRPRTVVGGHGKVTTTGCVVNAAGRYVKVPEGVRPTIWRSRTKVRDRDGVTRDVESWGSTKAKAEAALMEKVADRQTTVRNDQMRSGMTILAATKIWLDQVNRSDLAPGTKAQYADNVDRYVKGSQIQGLTLREVNKVAVIESYLQSIADRNGEGSARAARKALSGTLSLAVRYGVLEHNACKDVKPARALQRKESARDTRRALTATERSHLIEVVDADKRAQTLDVADLIAYMAGTGVRIGEALAQEWVDVDLVAGTVYVRGTKTESAERVLHLPPWLVDRLAKRKDARGEVGLVFPSPRLNDKTKLRESRNVHRQTKRLFEAAGMPWATPHSLRRTVASLMDAAGLSVAEAADQLGHANPAMTASVYLGRRSGSSRAASVL